MSNGREHSDSQRPYDRTPSRKVPVHNMPEGSTLSDERGCRLPKECHWADNLRKVLIGCGAPITCL